MKIKFLFLIGCLSISSYFYAQSVDNRNVFFIGHSLVNLDMPEMFDDIAASLNKTNAYDLQMGIGASLRWNYVNPHTAQGSNPFDELPTGNYNTLVMTEALPLVSQLNWGDTTFVYATNFHDLGAAANPNMQTYIYETWHCVNSGTPEGCDGDPNDNILWRDRLDQDLPLWESIADAIDDRSSYNTPPVLLVPAGQGLGAVDDNIALGTLPGLNDVSDLFSDNIHMNDFGNYFIALIQYATIYKESPVGAAANLTDIWGNPYNIPHQNTALINRLQEIAWEVVSNYPRSGVNSNNTPPPADLKSYIFGHSLVSHTQGDQSIPHWMYLLSQEAGQEYAVDGQFGFLPDQELPPIHAWGFDVAPSAWQGDFAATDYDNVTITAANFIQAEGPPTQAVIHETMSTVDATLRLFDYVRQEEADIPFYIYENWPEFNNFPPSSSEFQAYHNYTRGDFHNWWIDLQDLSNDARTDANIKLIPVGYVLSGLLTDIPALASIPAADLYEDGAPHGEAVIYFLTALIHYSALYSEKPPATYQVPNSLPAAVADNYSTIVDYIWDDLQAFNHDNGDSRVFFETAPPPPPVATDCELQIGTNLSGMFDWGTELPFVNLMKNAREWYTTNDGDPNSPFDSQMAEHLSYRSDGYPTHVPQTIPESSFPQRVKTIWAVTDGWPAGEYTVLYEGTGSLSFIGPYQNLTQVDNNKITFAYPQPQGGQLEMSIVQSDINDPIRNIRLLMPGTENTYIDQPFYSLYIERLQAFKTVRFMDWGSTNNWGHAYPWEWDNPNLYDWNDRAQMDHYTWTTPKGIPYEMMIKLMNDYDLNGWVCVPHRANNNYIQGMAQLFKNEVESERKLYVEYSNEIWNWGFGQTQWLNEYGCIQQGVSWPEGLAPYIQNCLDIWSNEFVGELDRIVRVAAVQTDWQDVSNRIINNLTPGSFDVLSPTFYFGLTANADAALDALGASATVADVAYWARESMSDAQTNILSQKSTLADVLGIPMVFYEGGQHLTAHPFGEEPTYGQALIDIHRDPEMYNLYDEWFDFLRTLQSGDEPMDLMHFSFIAPRSARYGSWGILETLDQDTDVIPAPKYQAILDNQNTGCGDAILSVEMISFEAKSKNCTIDLTWKINTSSNHDYFEVERSLNGRHFERIATLKTNDFYKNKNKYRFVDTAVSEELYYYRLKQVALDGTYDYSTIKTIQPDCLSALLFAISPNPTQGMLNISTSEAFAANTKIVLSNLLGQAIKVVPFQTQLDVSELASGVYFIQMLSDYQKSEAQRLVIHR